MKSGTASEQGDIVLIPFPFTDLSSVKQRPVLILSNNDYNKETDDIVTCGITSNLKDAAYSVLIDKGDLINGDIPVKSRIKVDKIFTLDQSLIRKKLAIVNKRIVEKVKQEILNLFQIIN